MPGNEIKYSRFFLFRYQILPISQNVQLTLDGSIISLEQLISEKNRFFLNAVTSIQQFSYSRSEIVHKILFNQGNIIVLKLGVNRDISRETRNFEIQELDNWPSTLIVINNDPTVQKIAIELERKAFQHPTTVADILEKNLNQILQAHQLHLRLSPIFEKNQFWDVIEKYPNQVIQVEFKMISPNLSNISGSLKLDLKTLNKTTNTQETSLQLNSDKDSSLTLARTDEFINSLVNYSSEGGGNITLKIKGITRKIQTSDSVTETSVESAELSTTNPTKIAELLREFVS